jgi:hypothetical protein
MTLEEAKQLLRTNNIEFNILEFSSEAEYWRHSVLFPDTKNSKPCKVIAIIIKSNNEKKNIELQFNLRDNGFLFEELSFGDYCFEMFDYKEEYLAKDLLENIRRIMSGSFKVILANDLKKHRWLGDACFDMNDDDDDFGKQGFEKAINRIKKPKSFISKLTKSKVLYEIYDWNTYQSIEK